MDLKLSSRKSQGTFRDVVPNSFDEPGIVRVYVKFNGYVHVRIPLHLSTESGRT